MKLKMMEDRVIFDSQVGLKGFGNRNVSGSNIGRRSIRRRRDHSGADSQASTLGRALRVNCQCSFAAVLSSSLNSTLEARAGFYPRLLCFSLIEARFAFKTP